MPFVGGVFALTTIGGAARAFETEVTATSAAQAYAFSSPLGSLTIKRRRYLQTLALDVVHLEGDEARRPGSPELSVRLRLRLDSDAGIAPYEVSYSPSSDRFVPGLSAAPVDFMYGYFEGKNLLGGWLGLRIGRQYVTSPMGWWAFDGGLVRVTTPAYLSVEAYGGLEERGGFPLSTPRFEQSGVWRGDRNGFDNGMYPQFAPAYAAPAYGIALESAGVTWMHGRLEYRKVINRGRVLASPLPNPLTGAYETYDATRVSSERLGYAVDASAMKVGGVKGGFVYDLYGRAFSTWYAQADWYAGERVTVGADYEYFRPTFDGDSIFTFFTHNPMKTVTGRVVWDAAESVDLALGGGTRSFTTDGNPATFVASLAGSPREETVQTDVLGNLSARYRYSNGQVGMRGMFERGERGHREGGDLFGERHWMAGRWTASARVSLFDWNDELRPDRSATSFAYVVGGGFRPSRIAQAMLEWEHDMNRLVGQRYRILAVVHLTVGK